MRGRGQIFCCLLRQEIFVGGLDQARKLLELEATELKFDTPEQCHKLGSD